MSTDRHRGLNHDPPLSSGRGRPPSARADRLDATIFWQRCSRRERSANAPSSAAACGEDQLASFLRNAQSPTDGSPAGGIGLGAAVPKPCRGGPGDGRWTEISG